MMVVAPVPTDADVKQAAPDAMLLAHVAEVRAAPAAVYTAIGRVGEWWDGAHTWSGDARNLSLDVRAGGCFCEQWAGGSVQHGRVVLAQVNDTVRLAAELGPMQDLAVAGVLTFKLAPAGEGTRIEFTYRVSGTPAHGLDKLAPIVDKVLGEQLSRLARFADR
jgi:uncharacterized protein YndB with AHSA1/START domain